MSEPFKYQDLKYTSLLDKIKLLFIKSQYITTKATINKKVYIVKLYYKILNGKIYYTKEESYDYEIE